MTFPTAKVQFSYMKEVMTVIIQKSIKIFPVSERSIDQISSMCVHQEEYGYNAKSELYSLTVLKKN